MHGMKNVKFVRSLNAEEIIRKMLLETEGTLAFAKSNIVDSRLHFALKGM